MTEASTVPNTAAYHLVGVELQDGWRATERVQLAGERTGSYFSVGYFATNASGAKSFVKALDYAAALEHEDPSTALAELTAQYNFERDVLRLCGDRKLQRVVRVLAAGKVTVPGFLPGVVNYLVFELADGDVRDIALTSTLRQVDMLRMGHDAAVAMAQLHSANIVHQDVKPSNLLFWNDPELPRAKLADLGCAYLEGRPRTQDALPVPGDVSHAPPEQLYSTSGQDPTSPSRRAADLYLLGNLICFLLVGVPFNALREMHLDRSQNWGRWGGSFDEVLPGLIDAHESALDRLGQCLEKEVREGVIALVDDLCYPDPALRGDPIARRRGGNPFRLERFITRIDLIHRKALVMESVR